MSHLPSLPSHSLDFANYGLEAYLEPPSPPQAMQSLPLHSGSLMEPLGLRIAFDIVDGAVDLQAFQSSAQVEPSIGHDLYSAS